MRTTLRIDDDVLQTARSLAKAESKSLGSVISALARKGLPPRPRKGEEAEFPVFTVSANAPPITLEMVKRTLEGD